MWTFRFQLCLLLLFASSIPALADRRTELLSQPSPGINFAGPVDYSTEQPFVDVFRLARKWISQRNGGGWGTGPELAVDQNGYVTRLEPDTWAETPLCTIEGGHYPSGTYTLFFEGTGEIEIAGAGMITHRKPGRYEVDVDSSKGPIWFRIRGVDPDDYLRNIHLVIPGYADTYQDNPWRPEFVSLWSAMKAFRTMDWQHTNNSMIASVDDFPTMQDASWTEHGLPIEMIADFANRTGKTPWVCVPHLATDDAVHHMATVLSESLDSDAVVIVEYSNEVWNGQFKQTGYVQSKGIEQKLAAKPWEAGWMYTGKRSIEIFKIFEDVFGGTDRLIRILPSQAANPFVSEQVVRAALADGKADALAIAPYLSLNVTPEKLDSIKSIGVDGIFRLAEREILPETIKNIRGNQIVAKQNGLSLMAYEAGQHFVGIHSSMNDDDLTALLQACNADPRMGKLYVEYLNAWNQNNGTLMCLFSSTGQWSKYGSWGLTQYMDDDPADSPKLQAVLEWAQ